MCGTHAYLVDKYNLNPRTDIIAHSLLDPSRRTDSQNALNRYGISWDQFIDDVVQATEKYFKVKIFLNVLLRGNLSNYH